MVVYIRPNSSFVKTYILLVLRWILQECGDFTWRVTDCEELVGVKSFLDNVQLVQLKKYGSKFIIVPVWDSFLSVYHKFGSSNTWELSKSK